MRPLRRPAAMLCCVPTIDGKGEGTVRFEGSGQVSSILTTIRFNPADYTTTAAEIAAYGRRWQEGWTRKRGCSRRGKTKSTTVRGMQKSTRHSDLITGKPSSPGESLTTVDARFDSKDVGHDKLITFSSYTLTGSADYALFVCSGTPAGSGLHGRILRLGGLPVRSQPAARSTVQHWHRERQA